MHLLESFVSDFAPNDVIICNSGKRSIVHTIEAWHVASSAGNISIFVRFSLSYNVQGYPIWLTSAIITLFQLRATIGAMSAMF